MTITTTYWLFKTYPFPKKPLKTSIFFKQTFYTVVLKLHFYSCVHKRRVPEIALRVQLQKDLNLSSIQRFEHSVLVIAWNTVNKNLLIIKFKSIISNFAFFYLALFITLFTLLPYQFTRSILQNGRKQKIYFCVFYSIDFDGVIIAWVSNTIIIFFSLCVSFFLFWSWCVVCKVIYSTQCYI